MSGPFKVIDRGARARLKADTPEGWHEPRPQGFEFVVEEYQPALSEGEAGFGDDDCIQVAFYYGNADGGFNNVCVPADIVEEVMSAVHMADRKIPDISGASRIVSSAMIHADEDDVSVIETNVTGARGGEHVEVYGRTADGLGFGMEIAVLRTWRTDD